VAFFTEFPDLVVPVLARALSDFEEFDPDEGGPHERVLRSLTPFGDAAASAVPALLAHLVAVYRAASAPRYRRMATEPASITSTVD
jgi:hypothetical protein